MKQFFYSRDCQSFKKYKDRAEKEKGLSAAEGVAALRCKEKEHAACAPPSEKKIIPVAAACACWKDWVQAGLGRKRHGKQVEKCLGIDRVREKNGVGNDCRRRHF